MTVRRAGSRADVFVPCEVHNLEEGGSDGVPVSGEVGVGVDQWLWLFI